MEKKSYFMPFGLKQICDITMILGAVLMIVGLFTAIGALNVAYVILGIGLGVYTVASALAILRAVLVLTNKKINHRAPEYKRAIVNTAVMSVIFVIALFGLLYLIIA